MWLVSLLTPAQLLRAVLQLQASSQALVHGADASSARPPPLLGRDVGRCCSMKSKRGCSRAEYRSQPDGGHKARFLCSS